MPLPLDSVQQAASLGWVAAPSAPQMLFVKGSKRLCQTPDGWCVSEVAFGSDQPRHQRTYPTLGMALERESHSIGRELFSQISVGSLVQLETGEKAEVRRSPHGLANGWLEVAVNRGGFFALRSVCADAVHAVLRLTQPCASGDQPFYSRGMCRGCQ